MAKKNCALAAAVMFMGALALSPVARAGNKDTYIDPTNGDDSKDCLSWTNACLTVGRINTVTSNTPSRVHMAEGVYTSLPTLNDQGFEIKGYGRVMMSPYVWNFSAGFTAYRYTTVENLTFLDSNLDVKRHSQIRNCRFINSNPTYPNNSTTHGIYLNDNSYGAYYCTIEGNLFVRRYYAILAQNGQTPNIIRNNTFVECVYGVYDTNADGNRNLYYNNIFYKCGNPAISATSGGIQYTSKYNWIDYNLFYQNLVDINGPTMLSTPTHQYVGASAFNPQFLSPADMNFYLPVDSPLLNAGFVELSTPTHGYIGKIGAFGAGLFSSKGYDNWAGWVDQTGTPVQSSSLVAYNEWNLLELGDGVVEAMLYSPVKDLGGGRKKNLHSLTYEAFQDWTQPKGSRLMVDQDQTTQNLREFRYRASATPFNQLDATPAWQTSYRDRLFTGIERFRYLQIELVMRSNGQ